MGGDEMSKSNPMSFRFSNKTVERILYLSEFFETSQSAVIDRAVRELYEREEERNKRKIRQLKVDLKLINKNMRKNSLSATDQALIEADNKALKALIADIRKSASKGAQ
jgi:hypothetical protein